MIKHSFLFILLWAWVVPTSAVAAPASPQVVASIRPLHSLVASVMQGVAEPALLVSGTTSPHGYQLTPSKRKLLEDADVIFYIDAQFETFLAHALEALPPSAHAVGLARAAHLELLPQRTGATWEAHAHTDAHAEDEKEDHSHHAEHHPHAALDYHVWLDPLRAAQMVRTIETTLTARYPAHAADFKKNAAQMVTTLEALDATLTEKLAPVRTKPFIVFHDAYQYLEQRYGLRGVGSITLHPEAPPSAARLSKLRQSIKENKVVCVFREPQYSERLVYSILEGSTARSATLDPLEYSSAPSTELYFTAMKKLTKTMVSCLSSTLTPP